jgi:hypothetical protein
MDDHTLTINEPTLKSTRQLIERLRQIGAATETATGPDLVELDEEAAVIHETLSGLLVSLLVDAGMVRPLTA